MTKCVDEKTFFLRGKTFFQQQNTENMFFHDEQTGDEKTFFHDGKTHQYEKTFFHDGLTPR